MRRLLLAAFGLILLNQAAMAALYDVDFEASGFTDAGGTTAPTDPVDGHVSFSFDPALARDGVVQSIDLAIGSVTYGGASFLYLGPESFALVGNNCTTGGCSVTPGVDQFFLTILNPENSALAMFDGLTYSTGGTIGIWSSATGSVAVTPIPAAAPLLLSALGGLGLVARRRTTRG